MLFKRGLFGTGNLPGQDNQYKLVFPLFTIESLDVSGAQGFRSLVQEFIQSA